MASIITPLNVLVETPQREKKAHTVKKYPLATPVVYMGVPVPLHFK